MVPVASSDLEPYLAGLFEAVGVKADDAAVVARSYVTAELAGLASHGVMRVPRIFAGIDAGTHFPSHWPSTVREGVAFAVLDGRSGLGVLVGACAMRLAVQKARARAPSRLQPAPALWGHETRRAKERLIPVPATIVPPTPRSPQDQNSSSFRGSASYSVTRTIFPSSMS